VAALIMLKALTYGYGRMGIPGWAALSLLLASLLGAYVNVPLVHFPDAKVLEVAELRRLGESYPVLVASDWPGMVLAVNVGGALIPAAVSIYLIVRLRLLPPAFFCAAAVAAAVYAFARPIPGLGIAVPVYVAPAAAAIAALIASRVHAAPLAYIGGSLGTLFGGDLLLMPHLLSLGSPLVSIGGAGTFDGIFISGILALLLACLALERLGAKSKAS
jgi:uncharacterized membrane protein